MGFKAGFAAGLGIGLILLGILFIGIAYQIYSVRVDYGDKIDEAYSITHSPGYNALIKLLGDISSTANNTVAVFSRIPYANRLLEPLIKLMLKAGEYRQQLIEAQHATEELSTAKLEELYSMIQGIGFVTIVIGIIMVIAGSVVQFRQRKKS